jgi:menaquinone-dependent protoporphyrinogen oxidase
MRVLIAYGTRYGTTAECARRLSDLIPGGAILADLGRTRMPDMAEAATVLIGGSIYGGKIQREVPAFCERARSLLLTRPVGLFVCCLFEDDRALAQLSSAFPDWLLGHAFARTWLGGELHPRALSLFDRLLVKGVPGADKDLARIQEGAIAELARACSKRLSRPDLP